MLHVPEKARILDHPDLGSSIEFGNNGAFHLPSCENGWTLFIICSDQDDWEHVSVHARKGVIIRTPSWKEMCFIKDLFWDSEDIIIQYHPKKSEYVNLHPGTLHLWRPIKQEIPTPPKYMVG